MNELSLYTGAGGGLLGTKLLGWRVRGYVEWDEYCQKIITQRIKDGFLDRAPIFGDIDSFISEGFAASYTGLVDVITAGFPCQPFSVAGKNEGEKDPRNKWPQTIECIRIIRPRFALLENVPNLFTHDYIRRIFGDLAESGCNVKWRMLSAAEMGAPHKRDREWILAYPSNRTIETGTKRTGRQARSNFSGRCAGPTMADTNKMRELQQEGREQNKRGRIGNSGEDVPDTNKNRLQDRLRRNGSRPSQNETSERKSIKGRSGDRRPIKSRLGGDFNGMA